jgi:hypothetical protein
MVVVPPVTSFALWLLEAVRKPDAGSRFLEGPFIVATSTRVSFRFAPGSPGGTVLRIASVGGDAGARGDR